MEWKTLDKEKAKEEFKKLFTDGTYNKENSIELRDDKLREIRSSLLSKFNECKSKGYEGFKIDAIISVEIYELLKSGENISIKMLSMFEFWFWVSIKLIPDIIYNRYEKNLKDESENINDLQQRYIGDSKRKTRIWPFMMWWGAHLTWQGNKKKTLDVLQNGFTVTAFETLLDRSRDGYRVDLFRALSLKFSNLYKEYQTNDKELLRSVIKLNSMKTENIEPAYYKGGIEEYVNDLFNPFIEKLRPKNKNIN